MEISMSVSFGPLTAQQRREAAAESALKRQSEEVRQERARKYQKSPIENTRGPLYTKASGSGNSNVVFNPLTSHDEQIAMSLQEGEFSKPAGAGGKLRKQNTEEADEKMARGIRDQEEKDHKAALKMQKEEYDA